MGNNESVNQHGDKGQCGRSVDKDLPIPSVISHLQDQLLNSPLALKVNVTRATSDDDDIMSNVGQLMQLSVDLPEMFDHCMQQVEDPALTHIILVVDRSGSMGGNPFKQVKLALEEILQTSIDDSSKIVDIVLYDTNAQLVQFGADNYKQVISNLKIGGTTNFKAAFNKVLEVMNGRKAKEANIDKTIILFMTDGNDTVNQRGGATKFAKDFAISLKSHSHTVIVHSIGFSADHDLRFLKDLCVAGGEEGLYRYCEPSDGSEALKNKLEELFDFVRLSNSQAVCFEVSFNSSDGKLLTGGSQSGTVEGVCEKEEKKGDQTATVITGECRVLIKDPTALPPISVGLQATQTLKKVKYNIQIPCFVEEVKYTLVDGEPEQTKWNLAVLSFKADQLASELADAVTSSKDVMKLKSKLEDIQNNLSKTTVFNQFIKKDSRALILHDMKDIQGKVDRMHSMLAQYVRGEASGVSLLARAHDLRYEAKFSKSRRERLMNRRVAQGFKSTKKASEEAKVVKEEDLKNLSSEAVDFYTCILSMCSVKEILTDPLELESALGIGLAVSRPEHAVDDPTSIRIFSISASLVSRSSVMDALEHKINMEGQLSAHGGFDFGNRGYATVGSSREPINAWLPLYITEAHWGRVKSCLRPSLGYLCTLDPLGYSDRQLDVMFQVLGTMIGSLHCDQVGENQIKLIYCLQRTCHALIQDLKLSSSITKIIQDFVAGPGGRFRHILPNLYVFIGYLVSLPAKDVKQAIGFSEDDNGKEAFRHLWVALVTELLRRANHSTEEFRENENKVTSLLNMLLHGQSRASTAAEMEDPCPVTVQSFDQMCWDLLTDSDLEQTLDIPAFELIKELKVNTTMNQSAKVDKAMAIWAQAMCEEIKNKNRSDQVADAKKTVKAWVAKLRDSVGLKVNEKEALSLDGSFLMAVTPGKATEVPPCGAASSGVEGQVRQEALEKALAFNTQQVNSSILQVTAKVLSRLSKLAHPPLSQLPGCMAFLEHWLTSGHSWQEVMVNGEMAPDNWISEVKTAVCDLFEKFEVHKKQFKTVSNGTGGEDGDEPDSRRNQPHGEGLLPPKQINDGHTDEDYDDDYDEDEPIAASRARDCAQRRERILTLPMLIEALNPQGDLLELIRAMLCQAVSYPSNSQARNAAESGELIDLAVPGKARTCLCHTEKDLILSKDMALKTLQHEALWELSNQCMLRADSMWAFLGYLMITYQERTDGFGSLLKSIIECREGQEMFPLLAEKVLVLLSGKYKGHIVLAKGNYLLPEGKLSKKLERVLGEEAWSDIELELFSNYHIHVYRESDIPNRHGHCNSNPYTPPQLHAYKKRKAATAEKESEEKH